MVAGKAFNLVTTIKFNKLEVGKGGLPPLLNTSSLDNLIANNYDAAAPFNPILW